MPKHEQVPFITLSGKQVNVDKGLEKVLILLKKHGVKTLYSCQGEYNKPWHYPLPQELAYISMDLKTTIGLARRIRKYSKQHRYSNRVNSDLEYFYAGTKELYIPKYYDDEGESLKTSKQFFWYKESSSSCKYEFDYNKIHGWRLIIRWDNIKTRAIEDLLGQTPVPKGRRWLASAHR